MDGKEQQLEDGQGQESQPQADAGTMDGGQDASQQAAGDDGLQSDQQDQGGAQKGQPANYQAELEKLQASTKELQSQFTKVSQESARNQELLKALEPYIDYSRLQPGQHPGGVPAGAEDGQDGAETYLTAKQVQQLLKSESEKLQGQLKELSAERIRQQYPDVCDKGPKEMIVRWYLANETNPLDPADKRMKDAVEKARSVIAGERQAGAREAEAARKAAEEAEKKKAAAAAQMAGTQSGGATSTKTSTPPSSPDTGESYIDSRRKKQEATKSVVVS